MLQLTFKSAKMWEENKLYMDGHVVPGTLTRRAEFFFIIAKKKEKIQEREM